MKNLFTTLALILGISVASFAQSQNLKNIDELLIGPKNVDRYYEGQIEYYRNSYEELQIKIEEKIAEVEESKLTAVGVQREIGGEVEVNSNYKNDQFASLENDLMLIDEFLIYWDEFEANEFQVIKKLSEEFDYNNCFEFYRDGKKLEEHTFFIEEEKLRKHVSWNEIAEYTYGRTRIEISPATTKWVKKKVDRNCKSKNPIDCLVWCEVAVPAVYETGQGIKCPTGMELSEDESYCIKESSTKKMNRQKIKIALLNNENPSKEIIISDYKIVDCKN